MAEHLAAIHGTERDRVNCPFFFKIGACRHGDRCSRLHNRPTISPTLLLRAMYQRPANEVAAIEAEKQKQLEQQQLQQQQQQEGAGAGAGGKHQRSRPEALGNLSAYQANRDRDSIEHFEDFYEDVFEELANFGELDSLNVCDNVCEHLSGNVYVKFRDEEAAKAAKAGLEGRYYGGKPIVCEFSPVTDFREAACRQYEERQCTRGGLCNFMHLRPVTKSLHRELFGRYRQHRGPPPRRDRSRSRSRSPVRRGGGSNGRGRRDDRDDDRGRRRERDSTPPARETSEERRAKIRKWNEERRRAKEAAEGTNQE